MVSAKTKGVYRIIPPSIFGIASIDIIILEEIRKMIPIQTEAMTPVSSELNMFPIIIPARIKNELIIKIEGKVKLNGMAMFELKNNFVIARSMVAWISTIIKAVT